jgi:hypothetical protein
MKSIISNSKLVALALVLVTAALTGCGNDPPVSTAGDDGSGGGAGTDGSGGPPEGTCYDSNGQPCNNDGAGTTGDNWGVYSFDAFESDPYNTWGFIDDMSSKFLTCYMDSSCREKMKNNDPSTRFQYLGDGNYEEAYQGALGCFITARNAGDCGYNLQMQSGTQGLLWGKVYLSAGNDGQEIKTQKANIGYDTGDKCAPAAVVVCSENAFTLKQYVAGTTP